MCVSITKHLAMSYGLTLETARGFWIVSVTTLTFLDLINAKNAGSSTVDNYALTYIFKSFEARISKLEDEVKALKGCEHEHDGKSYVKYNKEFQLETSGPNPGIERASKCKKCGEFYL